MDRRRFVVAAIGAAGMLGAIRAASAQEASQTDENALDEILSEFDALGGRKLETVREIEHIGPDKAVMRQLAMTAAFDVPPLSDALIAKLKERSYWKTPEKERASPAWPAMGRAPDYSHLSALTLASGKFSLTAEVLDTLAKRNAFELTTTRPVVVFGLRGCRISDGSVSKAWAQSHGLEVAEPDHIGCQCVVGLWRRADNQLAIFRASTVPAVAYMYISLAEQGAGASLLPCGLYSYRAGTHLANKPNSIQRGALCISGAYVALRTAKDLSFDPFSPTTAWTRAAAHNIHAGGSADQFGSAGCQVVPGGYLGADRLTPRGAWVDFQKEAGLVGPDGAFAADETKPSFHYMLLTGHEAAIASQGGAAFNNGYFRLRPGSRGQDVADLQKRLLKDHPGAIAGLAVNGVFDMQTTFGVLLDRKVQAGEYTSPVVSI